MNKVADKEKEIEAFVNEHGFLTTGALAAKFKMTPQSVRRYTKSLSDKGLVRRTHGGVATTDYKTHITAKTDIGENHSSMRIKSMGFLCFESLRGNNRFAIKVIRFLKQHSRIDPLVHSIIETPITGSASSEADKVLRKIERPQVAIFCEVLSDDAINVALIARKRNFESFLICEKISSALKSDIQLLRNQQVGLLSLEAFKSEWKYARI